MRKQKAVFYMTIDKIYINAHIHLSSLKIQKYFLGDMAMKTCGYCKGGKFVPVANKNGCGDTMVRCCVCGGSGQIKESKGSGGESTGCFCWIVAIIIVLVLIGMFSK